MQYSTLPRSFFLACNPFQLRVSAPLPGGYFRGHGRRSCGCACMVLRKPATLLRVSRVGGAPEPASPPFATLASPAPVPVYPLAGKLSGCAPGVGLPGFGSLLMRTGTSLRARCRARCDHKFVILRASLVPRPGAERPRNVRQAMSRSTHESNRPGQRICAPCCRNRSFRAPSAAHVRRWG